MGGNNRWGSEIQCAEPYGKTAWTQPAPPPAVLLSADAAVICSYTVDNTKVILVSVAIPQSIYLYYNQDIIKCQKGLTLTLVPFVSPGVILLLSGKQMPTIASATRSSSVGWAGLARGVQGKVCVSELQHKELKHTTRIMTMMMVLVLLLQALRKRLIRPRYIGPHYIGPHYMGSHLYCCCTLSRRLIRQHCRKSHLSLFMSLLRGIL